jgi:tetratricopeptide (TPR) repeat protein
LLFFLFVCSCAGPRILQQFHQDLDNAPEDGSRIKGLAAMKPDGRKDGLTAVNALVSFWNQAPILPSEADASYDLDQQASPVDETMLRRLAERELWAFASYGTIPALDERLQAGLPVIAMLQDDPEKMASRRYVLVFGINRRSETLLLYTGRDRAEVYDYAAFKKAWRPIRNWMAFICPAEHQGWSMNVQEHLARARFHETRGRWPEALTDYEDAEKLDPRNASVTLARANALYRKGDADEALLLYKKVQANNDGSARAANNLAFVLVETGGDLNEAERLARRAITMEPANPVFMDTMGYIFLQTGRPAEAASLLARAHHRAGGLALSDQRNIATRLIEAYLESDQAHLARQVWIDRRLRDPEFSVPEPLRGRIPE